MSNEVTVYAVKTVTNRATGSVGIHSCWYTRKDAERIAGIHNGVNGDYWVEEVRGIPAHPDMWGLRGQVLVEGSNGYIPVNRL